MKIIKTCFSQKIFKSPSPSLSPPLPKHNPGHSNTTVNPYIAFPCGICHKSVNANHNAVLCDICNKWIHIKCNYLNKIDYEKLKYSKETFYCLNCTKAISPFTNLNNNEFYTSVTKGALNTENKTIDFRPSVNQLNLFNRLNNFIVNTKLDTDEDQDDLNHMVNCKYYSIDEFTSEKFCSSRTFSILHYNIHSIQRHIEEFRLHLQMLDFDFDIICISD